MTFLIGDSKKYWPPTTFEPLTDSPFSAPNYIIRISLSSYCHTLKAASENLNYLERFRDLQPHHTPRRALSWQPACRNTPMRGQNRRCSLTYTTNFDWLRRANDYPHR